MMEFPKMKMRTTPIMIYWTTWPAEIFILMF